MTETEQQIARLTRATAARERCARMATNATVKAALAHTAQIRGDYQDIAREARLTRDEWDAEIRSLRSALTAV